MGFQSKTYNAWLAMKTRCNNSHAANYEYYGGRGIGYDAKWERFAGFYADMGQAPAGLELDRIDNNGHYTKSNCRWSTRQVNGQNRRSVKLDAVKVAEIKATLKQEGRPTYAAIASRYGVNKLAISLIANNHSWSNI